MAIAGWIAAAVLAFIFAPQVEPLVREIPVVGEFLADSCELSIIGAFLITPFVVEDQKIPSDLVQTNAEIVDTYSRTIWGSDDVPAGSANYAQLRYSTKEGSAQTVEFSVTDAFFNDAKVGDRVAVSYSTSRPDFAVFEGKAEAMSANRWRFLLTILLLPLVLFGLFAAQSAIGRKRA